MGKKEATNPFYVTLLPVGVIFALTACAYAVMAVRALDVRRGEPSGLMRLLGEHGMVMLVAELAALGLLCVAAIASDGYWERRHAARQTAHLRQLPQPPSLDVRRGSSLGGDAKAGAVPPPAGTGTGAIIERGSEGAS